MQIYLTYASVLKVTQAERAGGAGGGENGAAVDPASSLPGLALPHAAARPRSRFSRMFVLLLMVIFGREGPIPAN